MCALCHLCSSCCVVLLRVAPSVKVHHKQQCKETEIILKGDIYAILSHMYY